MAQCLTPYRLKTGIDVPCGKCGNCLKRRVNGWSFRLLEQNKWARSAHFVTLTYDTKVIPISPKGRMTLNKKDLQLFFKRLRHVHTEYAKKETAEFLRRNPQYDNEQVKGKFEPLPIKYYACGEYGTNKWRPHYHIILFNSTMEAITAAWQLEGKMLGHVHIDEVNGATINYTLKYMCKKSRVPQYSGDDRMPEFSIMSKGIGATYVNDAARKFHKVEKTIDGKVDLSGSRMFLVMPGGWKTVMPRYYKDKLFPNEFERSVIGYISGHKARIEDNKHIGDDKYWRDLEQAKQAALRMFNKHDSRDFD